MSEEVIKLTSSRGILKISHDLPELRKALRFHHRFYADGGEAKFFDPHLGKVRVIKKRGPLISKYEALYSEGEDGSLYTHDGMLNTVADTLVKAGREYTYERLPPAWPKPVLTADVVEGLYPEQRTCFIRMLSMIGGALIEAATSAGKTRIIKALLLAYRHERVVILTYSKSVVRGLQKNLNALLAGTGLEVGICMGDNVDIKQITVATVGSAHYLDPSKVDVLIGDEFHRFAAPSFSETWLQFDRAVKYGLSATLKDRFDGKFRYLESLTGPVVHEVSDQELEEAGRVPPLHAYFMSVPTGPAIDHLSDIRRKKVGIWCNQERNALIKAVADRVPKDQQLLIFVLTKQHLDELVKLMPEFEVCHGELPNKERARIEDRFTSGEAKRIISTDCLSEGVDPRHLMVMIDASAVKGDSSLVQKRGRLRRPGKPFGVLIQFSDEWSNYLKAQAKKRVKEHQDRGDTVYELASPEEIQFVTPVASPNPNPPANL